MSARAPKLIKLRPWSRQDADTVLDILRDTARAAKQGRATAVCIILLEDDGTTRGAHHYGSRTDFLRLVGAVDEWKHRTFVRRAAQEAEET